MYSRDLINSIVSRTGLSHDEVKAVLDCLRDITAERLSIYESTMIPGMLKVSAKYLEKRQTWRVHLSPFRALQEAVGSATIPTGEEKIDV